MEDKEVSLSNANAEPKRQQPNSLSEAYIEDQQIQDGVNELVAILFEHWLEQRQKAREERSSDQHNAPDTS